jgi:hypothetical protein
VTSDNFMPAVGAMGIVTRGLGFGVVMSDGCAGGVAMYISSRRMYVPEQGSAYAITVSHRLNLRTFADLKSTVWTFGMP